MASPAHVQRIGLVVIAPLQSLQRPDHGNATDTHTTVMMPVLTMVDVDQETNASVPVVGTAMNVNIKICSPALALVKVIKPYALAMVPVLATITAFVKKVGMAKIAVHAQPWLPPVTA